MDDFYRKKYRLGIAILFIGLIGCSSAPKITKGSISPTSNITNALAKGEVKGDRREIVLYALSLLGIHYQFGSGNPEAGLDCSGMVGFIYKNALGIQLPRSAAQIAKIAKTIPRSQLQAGDFVFFNTMNRPYSHMGIYIGNNQFIHAPASRGQVKLACLDTPYFARRFEGGATVFK